MTLSHFLNLLAAVWQFVWLLLKVAIEVGLLAALIYVALLFMQGTRAIRILTGIVLVTFVGWFISQSLGLEVIEWMLAKVPTLLALAVLIIFQPELRRAFAEIGANPGRFFKGEHNIVQCIDALVNASYYFADRKIGALVAIERDIGMRAIADAGVRIDAPVSAELLMTIFYPNAPLHDGAVIIRDGVIVAASCFFPLTQTPLTRELGTRHRAGVGITEETDAVVIIVSEERGTVSIATRGILVQDISKSRLRRHLTNYLVKRPSSAKGAKNPGTKTVTDT